MGEDIHWQKYTSRFKSIPTGLDTPVSGNVGIVVCIPVYAEPSLVKTLDSLFNCELPKPIVEVILLFNKSNRMTPEDTSQHELTWQNTMQWINSHQKEGLQFLPIYVNVLPDPKGGVGWARKLALDEAARRIDQDDIMICLDADCTIGKNYLKVIHSYFMEHPNCDAASVYFEHQLDHLEPEERQAIVEYELHLRYLVHAMRWAGHPFSFQTVGSSMAVRRKAYLAQGGMNTRQAGEDFYFLQKFIEIGSLHEIKLTTVFPSSRVSTRVPFGTGRAMQTLMSSSINWTTTDFKVFRMIKSLLSGVEAIRKYHNVDENKIILYEVLGLDERVIVFLNRIGFLEQCQQIALQTTTAVAFRKRFYRYFNSFMMIRYSHFISEHYIPEAPVAVSALDLLSELNSIDHLPNQFPVPEDVEGLLLYFRQLDKGHS